MPRREDDDVDRGPAAPGSRTLLQAGGFLLAVGATLSVVLTDDAQLLKIAVVAVAWGFVLATFAAGRGRSDRARAAAREAELQRAYAREREAAARREQELELENELRRDTEGSVREELAGLRRDIAALADLRDEVARVSRMHGDIAAVGGLRDQVARVAALRDDVAALAGLRSELGQLAALREDMGRLRAELAEQLSSELLVERIVMRTQGSRLPGEGARSDDPARVLDGGAPWTADAPPRELTGGWPAIRLDEPRDAHRFEQVHTSTRSAVPPPPTTAFPAAPPPAHSATAGAAPAAPRPPVPPRPSVPEPSPSAFVRHDRAAAHEHDPYLGSGRSRHVVDGLPSAPARTVVTSSPALPPTGPPRSSLEWSGDTPPVPAGTGDAPRRRRADGPLESPAPGEFDPTTQQPAVTPSWATPQRTDGGRVAGQDPSDRLAQILAENGVSPSSGGRRRRRYREDGQSDDVLARVLGRD